MWNSTTGIRRWERIWVLWYDKATYFQDVVIGCVTEENFIIFFLFFNIGSVRVALWTMSNLNRQISF